MGRGPRRGAGKYSVLPMEEWGDDEVDTEKSSFEHERGASLDGGVSRVSLADFDTDLGFVAEQKPPGPGSAWEEAVLVLRIAAPSVMIQLFLLLQWTTSAVAVGTLLGTEALTGFSLGNLSGNLTGLSIVFGVLSAIDTLGPQAIGAGRHTEVGSLCVRGLLLCMLAFVPAVFFWWNVEPVLLALGQPPVPSKLAARFLRFYVAAVPSLVVFELARRFLTCQNVVNPVMFISGAATLVFHPLFLWCGIHWLGFDGLPCAHAATNLTQCMLLLGYIRWRQPHDPRTWTGVPPLGEVLQWAPTMTFLRLAVPGVLSMSEWWYWEAACFLAGRLGTNALASHTVAYNTIPVAFMIPYGISIGIATRVGTLLPQGDEGVAAAKRVAKLFVGAGMVTCCLYATAMLFVGRTIAGFFTSDEAVLLTVARIWPWVCAFLVVDGWMALQQGVMRGLGFQGRLSAIMLVCLWALGLPVVWHVSSAAVSGDDPNARLTAIWASMLPVYCFLDTAIVVSYARSSWAAVGAAILLGEGDGPT